MILGIWSLGDLESRFGYLTVQTLFLDRPYDAPLPTRAPAALGGAFGRCTQALDTCACTAVLASALFFLTESGSIGDTWNWPSKKRRARSNLQVGVSFPDLLLRQTRPCRSFLCSCAAAFLRRSKNQTVRPPTPPLLSPVLALLPSPLQALYICL